MYSLEAENKTPLGNEILVGIEPMVSSPPGAEEKMQQLQPGEITVLVTHKGCNDGNGAKFAAWLMHDETIRYISQIPGEDAEIAKKKKQRGVDWSVVKELCNECICFADICPPHSVYLQLRKQGNRILVIDHHKSSVDDMASVANRDKIFNIDHSGAHLAWSYFHPGKPVPLLIQYIEARDLWLEKTPLGWDNVSALFEYITLLDGNMEEYRRLLSEEDIQRAIESTRILVRRRDQELRWIIDRTAVKAVELNGELRLVGYVNTDQYISDAGNAIIRRFPVDLAALWKHHSRGDSTPYSLRSNNRRADVSTVAESFGGGGHAAASGMRRNGLTPDLAEGITINPVLLCTAWDELVCQRSETLEHIEELITGYRSAPRVSTLNDGAVVIQSADSTSKPYRLPDYIRAEVLEYSTRGFSRARFLSMLWTELYRLLYSEPSDNSLYVPVITPDEQIVVDAWLKRYSEIVTDPETGHALSPESLNIVKLDAHLKMYPSALTRELHHGSGITSTIESEIISLKLGLECIHLIHFTGRLTEINRSQASTALHAAHMVPLFTGGIGELQRIILERIVVQRWGADSLVIDEITPDDLDKMIAEYNDAQERPLQQRAAQE
jgi:oligoribonuclease NrnB/cAMP/cGMP phosphodiesterase (DHH superfamily)